MDEDGEFLMPSGSLVALLSPWQSFSTPQEEVEEGNVASGDTVGLAAAARTARTISPGLFDDEESPSLRFGSII